MQRKLYMNPTEGIYVLHSVHGQFSGCHFNLHLKKIDISNSFNVLGTKFHILVPRLTQF